MPFENTYVALQSRWKSLRSTHDVSVREVACVGASRTLLCVETGDVHAPRISLSAGVHGDEPAGVWALLHLVEHRLLDDRFAYRIWPCVNPTGFDAKTRSSSDNVDVNRTFGRGGQSPEARAIVMANRDRKFVLAIDLHEDIDAGGFYHYEYGGGVLGVAVLEALEAEQHPIDPLDTLVLGSAELESALRREHGRIVADPFEEATALGGLSQMLLLMRGETASALTFETPTSLPPELRLAMHVRATQAAIAALSAALR